MRTTKNKEVSPKSPELNITEDEISTIGYEFYKFFKVFKDELHKNHERDLQDPANKFDDFMEFPVYCFAAFTRSYLEYKDENI
jgi:hypothetical protein